MPPASGKTLVFCLFIKDFISRDPDNKAIILSPLKAHTYQNSRRLYESTGITSTSFCSETKLLGLNSRVFSTTYRSFQKVFLSLENPDKCIIICDEFHKMSEIYLSSDFCAYAFRNVSYALLVSGTPKKSRGISLYNAFPVFTLSLKEAIDMNVVCNYEVVCVSGDLYNANSGDTFKWFNDAISQFQTVKKSIMFVKDRKTARELVEMTGWDRDIFMVDSGTTSETRDEIMSRFQSSEKSVIVNIQIFNEAIDLPDCDSIFISNVRNQNMMSDERATTILQRLSRATRKSPNKETSLIFINAESSSQYAKTSWLFKEESYHFMINTRSVENIQKNSNPNTETPTIINEAEFRTLSIMERPESELLLLTDVYPEAKEMFSKQNEVDVHEILIDSQICWKWCCGNGDIYEAKIKDVFMRKSNGNSESEMKMEMEMEMDCLNNRLIYHFLLSGKNKEDPLTVRNDVRKKYFWGFLKLDDRGKNYVKILFTTPKNIKHYLSIT